MYIYIYILAFPADIGRKPARGSRQRLHAGESRLCVTRTRRLIKRPTVQHGGARMSVTDYMRDNPNIIYIL